MAKRGPKAADGKHVFEKVDEFGEVATAVEQRERGGEGSQGNLSGFI